MREEHYNFRDENLAAAKNAKKNYLKT